MSFSEKRTQYNFYNPQERNKECSRDLCPRLHPFRTLILLIQVLNRKLSALAKESLCLKVCRKSVEKYAAGHAARQNDLTAYGDVAFPLY